MTPVVLAACRSVDRTRRRISQNASVAMHNFAIGGELLEAAESIGDAMTIADMTYDAQRKTAAWCRALDIIGDRATQAELNKLLESARNNHFGLNAPSLAAYVAKKWHRLGNRLRGIDDGDADMKEYLMEQKLIAKLSEGYRSSPRVSKAVQPAYSPPRQSSGFGGAGFRERDYPSAPRAQPRGAEPGRDDSPGAIRYRANLTRLFRTRADMLGKCFSCEYVGSIPPGTEPHTSSTQCPQLRAGMKKMGIAP